MLRIILAAIVMGVTLNLDAQTMKEREVPVAVVSKINSLYPDASKMKWEGEDGMYEASFMSDKKELSVLLTRDGQVIVTEEEVATNSLPGSIMQYIGMHHPTSKVSEANLVTDNLGAVQYEVEVDGIEYLFDSTGQFLRQAQDDDNDDDDKD